MPDTILRRTLRTLLPKPIRAAYWRAKEAVQRRRIAAGTAHERHVCDALRTLVRPGDVCLDVGANVGLLTVFMGRLAGPSGRVHAFELFEGNVASLRRNLRWAIEAGRVTITHAAVSDGSQRELTFYAGRNRSNAEWTITGIDANGRAAEPVATVAAIALDAHFPAEQRIDVVKIDVEGAESQVLAGMRRILRQWRPRLLIECHTAENWRACAALAQQGYALSDVHGEALDPAADYPATHIVAVPQAQPQSAAA